MSYDMDMCSGERKDALSPCPLRDKCKRYVLGLKALSENYYPIWWIVPPYENGKCKIFIGIRQ